MQNEEQSLDLSHLPCQHYECASKSITESSVQKNCHKMIVYYLIYIEEYCTIK